MPCLPRGDAAAPAEREGEEGRAILLSIPALPGDTLVRQQGHPGRGARMARDGATLPGVRHADREARPSAHGALLLVLRALAQ